MLHVLLSSVLVLPAGVPAAGGSFASPALARDVVKLLQGASLDAIAAQDPEQSGRFVAALHVGDQLLVIETVHPTPAAISRRISAGLYRDVYLDLQGAAGAGKFFVQDADGDGLLAAAPGQGSVDVVYGEDGRSLLLNGDPKGQQTTEAEYNERITAADMRYSHMLAVLKQALEKRATH